MQRDFTRYDLLAGIMGLQAQMPDVIRKMMEISMVQVTLAMIFTGMVMAKGNLVPNAMSPEVHANGKALKELSLPREIQHGILEVGDYIAPAHGASISGAFNKERSETVRDEFFAITVNGKVTDANDLPIPGVSILLKGTNTGTVTDADGNYDINVPDTDAVLVW